jgi:hypothetical protein
MAPAVLLVTEPAAVPVAELVVLPAIPTALPAVARVELERFIPASIRPFVGVLPIVRYLLLDLVSQIFNRFTDLAPASPDRLLDVAGNFVGLAFLPQLLVVAEIAGGLFDAALQLVGFSMHFILVPHEQCLLRGAAVRCRPQIVFCTTRASNREQQSN